MNPVSLGAYNPSEGEGPQTIKQMNKYRVLGHHKCTQAVAERDWWRVDKLRPRSHEKALNRKQFERSSECWDEFSQVQRWERACLATGKQGHRMRGNNELGLSGDGGTSGLELRE